MMRRRLTQRDEKESAKKHTLSLASIIIVCRVPPLLQCVKYMRNEFGFNVKLMKRLHSARVNSVSWHHALSLRPYNVAWMRSGIHSRTLRYMVRMQWQWQCDKWPVSISRIICDDRMPISRINANGGRVKTLCAATAVTAFDLARFRVSHIHTSCFQLVNKCVRTVFLYSII